MQHELNTIWPRQMLRRAHAVPCRRPLFARFAGLALPPHPLCRAPARIRACAAAFRINRPETMPCHPHACLVTHRTLPPSPKQMWVLDRPGGDQPCPPPSIPPPAEATPGEINERTYIGRKHRTGRRAPANHSAACFFLGPCPRPLMAHRPPHGRWDAACSRHHESPADGREGL